MPWRHEPPPPIPSERRYVEALVKELRQPSSPETATDEPDIVEREEPRTGRFAVTVLWDKWSELDLKQRGAVIMDAYREAKGEDVMLKISSALGLTAAEADKLRINFH